jgi:AcrR family transcriptional regulator
MTRQDLLAAVIADLQSQGLGDRSLRDIAASVGTSHRMLIHHFGSRQGLLTEVVNAVEQDQKLFLASLDGDNVAVLTAMWAQLRDPRLWPNVRLFFECYARAMNGEEPFKAMLPSAVDDWVERAAAFEVAQGVPQPEARARARAGLATFRGLLLDLVGTGDQAGVDAAFGAFAAQMALGRPTS